MSASEDDKIESAASYAGYGFLSIAKHLRQLQDEDPAALEIVVKLLRIDHRDAECLIRVDRTFRDLGVDDNHMAAIGWPKLVVLCDYVSSSSLHRLLEFADKIPAKELAGLVGRRPDMPKRMVLNLTPEQFEVLKEAILSHGGKWSDPGLDKLAGKEEALVKALNSKSA